MKETGKIILGRCFTTLAFVMVFSICITGSAQNVVAWGNNTQGQTNVPPSATNVVAVAAGWYHSLALRNDGTVIAWGSIPIVPGSATNVIGIASGASNNIALQADGSVLCWGDNSWGQTNVPIFPTNVVSIAAGNFHNLALMADSTVMAWGKNVNGQASVPIGLTNVIAVSAGAEHSMALKDDGSVIIWGGNSPPYTSAKNALPSSAKNVVAMGASSRFNLYLFTPGFIYESGSYSVSPPSSASNIVAIATSTNFSLALNSSGQLIGWGTGTATNPPSSATNIIAMAVGLAHGLAVRGDGSPRILGSPAYSAVTSAGNNLPLFAKAVGTSTLRYQWLANGVPIIGATNALPTVPATWGNDTAVYQVVVSNTITCVTSSIAKVTVRSLNIWGVNSDGQTKIPRSVINPSALAAGPFHNLAIQGDNTVVAWGKNWNGQTIVPAGTTNIIMVAAGSDHSLALKNNGSVIAWGKNLDGQTNVPISATNVVAVAAGWAHSVALRTDGSVVAWGNNDYGQISVSFRASQVISIAAGYYHTLALKADGSVVSWGYQTDVPPAATNVTAIAAGWGHNLALRSDGTIIAWGDNTFGQSTIPPTATNVIAISAGWYLSMALRADGTIITWGKKARFANSATNTPACLSGVGNIDAGEDHCAALVQTGSPSFSLTAATISASQGGQIFYRPTIQGSLPMTYQWSHNGVDIAGQTNSYLLIQTARVSDTGSYELIASNQYGTATNAVVTFNVSANPNYCSAVGAWGSDLDGQCDVIPDIINPVALAAGAFHNLALQGDGSVVAWGKNWNGQTNVPLSATNVIAIAAGSDHSLALSGDGSVIAWGRNWDRQNNVPASATNVVAIAAGWAHSLALRADGTVVAWGNNDYGQTNTPQNLTDVIAIAAGYYHNLALRSDHSIVSWGSQYTVPASITNAIAISAGWEHNLVLTGDGKVIAWGDNSYGQCSVPNFVTNANAIEAGFGHSMVRLSDGTVVAWGKSYFGVTNVPVGLKNVASMSCGEDHELAMVGYGPPQIQLVKQTATAHLGGRGLLAANLQGTFPLSCQWYHDATPVAVATNNWLLLTNLQTADAGTFTLVVSNNAGQSTSAPLIYSVNPSPYFLTPLPTQQSALVGNPLCLAVNAEGMSPLAFQSQLNGANMTNNGLISGTATPNLCFTPAAFEDSGLLTLIITNDFGSYTGLLANLAITPVIGWGDNSSGQLQVPASATNVVALACGGDHNLALLADGSMTAWGDNSFNQNTIPPSINQAVAIAEGDTHSLALKPDGSVVAWGDNSSGQTNVPGTVKNAVAIAAGTRFSQALMPDGNIIQWGASHYISSAFTNVILLSTKGTHSIALRADGTVLDTLQGSVSQTNVFSICAGISDSLILRSDGSLAAWGKNYYGQTNIPASATNIVAITAGEDHFVALRADGVVIVWGSTNFSQTQIPVLTQCIGLISAGSIHSLAVLGQPFQRMAKAGEEVVFSAGSLANRLATYQWQFNGTNIPGATKSTLTFGNVYWTNAGIYRVVISNTLGGVTSPAMTLSVPPLKLDVVGFNMVTTNGAFQIRLTGSSGLNPVTIYSSSNLLDWQPVSTNPPTTGTIDFTDMPPTVMPQRFYRAIEQP